MARVSFTLRKGAPQQGSFLRYDPAQFPELDERDDDLSLRGAPPEEGVGPLFPPTEEPVGFLDVYASCYGEVEIEWSVPGLVDTRDQVLEIGEGVEESFVIPTEVVIVYSSFGSPQTILSGQVLVESAGIVRYVHRNLPQGKWAYYSLFVRYTDIETNRSYYEPLASAAALVPRDYGSTDDLWQRIPLYYRIFDDELATPLPKFAICGRAGERWGPLRKMLSIIGFEMDRLRTICDAVVVSRDVALGAPEALDYTAALLGIPLRSSDLGDQRLRRLLSSIGYLRSAKGTTESLRQYLTSLIGADFSVFENGELRVHNQRVNYAPSPKVLGASPGYAEWRPARIDEVDDARPFGLSEPLYTTFFDEFEYRNGAWKFIDEHFDNTRAYETLEVSLGLEEVAELTSDTGELLQTDLDETLSTEFVDDRPFLIGQMWKFNVGIPVRNGDRVIFSLHGVGKDLVVWARLSSTQTGGVFGEAREVTLLANDDAALLTDDDNELTGVLRDPFSSLVEVGLANYFEIPVVIPEERELDQNGWVRVDVEILVDLRRGPFSGDRMLIERNNFGTYFDGDFVRGGWLIGPQTISDFRWAGARNNSPSLYTEDYERSKNIVNLVYRQLLPVNVDQQYTMTQFDYIPGTEEVLKEVRFDT
jgi:hypothetical protein